VRADVFAADGTAPRIPGPLIRVTAGTPVHITLRNCLPDSIAVRGLRDRSTNPPPNQRLGAFIDGFVEVAPGGLSRCGSAETELPSHDHAMATPSTISIVMERDEACHPARAPHVDHSSTMALLIVSMPGRAHMVMIPPAEQARRQEMPLSGWALRFP
jgi:hypothetical protein